MNTTTEGHKMQDTMISTLQAAQFTGWLTHRAQEAADEGLKATTQWLSLMVHELANAVASAGADGSDLVELNPDLAEEFEEFAAEVLGGR